MTEFLKFSSGLINCHVELYNTVKPAFGKVVFTEVYRLIKLDIRQ